MVSSVLVPKEQHPTTVHTVVFHVEIGFWFACDVFTPNRHLSYIKVLAPAFLDFLKPNPGLSSVNSKHFGCDYITLSVPFSSRDCTTKDRLFGGDVVDRP